MICMEVKLATIVEDTPKAPFSTATKSRGREGCYSFPWISPLYPCYVPLNAVLSKEVLSTIFWVFGTTLHETEHRSPGPFADTLPTRSISGIRDDVNRQYVSRKEGGRGLPGIEISVDKSIRRLGEQRKFDYSDQKQHKHQQKNNNKKAKMER